MDIHLIFGLHVLGNLIGLLAAGYAVIAVIATAAGVRARRYPVGARPPVTILKPLCGVEPRLYESLRSFCIQNYPCYQIVFGVNDAHDPALAIARRLQDEFPDRDISVVADARSIGSNRKVDNLANMLRAARYDYLIVADSDIRVKPDYLARVVAPLADASVGLVTCLYRARPDANPWSRLGSMFVNHWFGPSVLVSRLLGRTAFAFGATIGIRRASLEAIGGFAAIANHLADDYRLGQMTRALGLKTVLSDYIVETAVHDASLAELMAHESRWMRTIRAIAPLGYAFTFITCSLPLALLGVLLTWGGPLAILLLLATVFFRAIICYIQVFSSAAMAWSDLWLIPLREGLTACAWCRGLSGRKILWRDQQYAVARDGSLYKTS